MAIGNGLLPEDRTARFAAAEATLIKVLSLAPENAMALSLLGVAKIAKVELTRLQTWVKDKGARVIVVFEGRDTAGKGGVISRITARTSPRVFRHVALPARSDREKSQVYLQRYIAQFPAAGEIILFDRSWYNRAGVERVMGFCNDEEYEHFMAMAPATERELIVKNGIILRKYFLDVGQDEQRRRFEARITDT